MIGMKTIDMPIFDVTADSAEIVPGTVGATPGWLRLQAQIGHGASLMKEGKPEIFQFVTVYTQAQNPWLASSQAKKLLLAKLQDTKSRFDLEVAGYVVLHDHMHFVYTTSHYLEVAPIVDCLREGYTRDWCRLQRRESKTPHPTKQEIWQAHFHSYSLTEVTELRTHLDFIHYDPVRHGLVERAMDYAWSSLPARVHQGHYAEDWAVMAPPAGIAKVARSLYLSA